MTKLAACLAVLFTASVAGATPPLPMPKNVILIIGDGMGPAHFTAARHTRGADFAVGRMPFIGLMTTSSADRYVTDSAAAATALSTGRRTNYEWVALDPATGEVLQTVLEVAEKAGKATGLVTTAVFYDATPAAFAAHARHRHNDEVAVQVIRSGVDVLIGAAPGGDSAGRVPILTDLARQAGFTVARSLGELNASTKLPVLGMLAGQPRDMDHPEASLATLARFAIDRLRRDPDGFFLMIEHEGTDSASHQNNNSDVLKAVASYDQAVEAALAFAAAAGDTLVIATGDHETGGLRVTETKSGRFRLEWSTSDHTATAIPIFAYGPSAPLFATFTDNAEMGKKILALVR